MNAYWWGICAGMGMITVGIVFVALPLLLVMIISETCKFLKKQKGLK